MNNPHGEELMSKGIALSMQPSFDEEYVGQVIEANKKVVTAFKER